MISPRIPLLEPFDLALSEYYRSKPQMARYKRLVTIGARIGDPLAQYAMATWYLHGNSEIRVQKNVKKAVELLEACSVVFNRAAYDLAVCKCRGIGTKKDLKGAFRLFVWAANLGLLAAMDEQRRCLTLGIGTKRDPESARLLQRRVAQWKRELRYANLSLPRSSTAENQPHKLAHRTQSRRKPVRPTLKQS